MAIDVIGTIYDKDFDAPNALPGYHVNSTHDIPEWSDFKVDPETPIRVWLGTDAVHCYKFDSKEHYESQKLEVE